MNFSNSNLIGLNNLGNTCFFNSVLQLLCQATILNKLILSNNNIKGKFIDIYSQFLLNYSSNSNSESNSEFKSSVLSPNKIIEHVSKVLKRGNYQQEDAEQYLNYIIDTLISELSVLDKNLYISSKNMSLDELVNNLFTIQINKIICCPNCNHKSISNDNNNILYLSILPQKEFITNTLDDLIKNYLSEEILDDNNKWKCDKCKNLVNAKIYREIKKLPKYLIVVLKRYTNNNTKNNSQIIIPDYINHNKKKLEQRGFVYHSGSTNGGHYVYYGKRNDKWYLHNDSSVNSVSNNEINNISKLGYIYLFVTK
jgi:ubiquitin C-terminal hydrolase